MLRSAAGRRIGARDDAAHGAAASPLFGREEELRHLTDAVGRMASGHGAAVFISGEAGMGKTRLAREALEAARARSALVLEGRGYPMESGLAYALLLDAFGPYLRGLGDRPRRALTHDLPGLGRLFTGLEPAHAAPLADLALEKTRLFEDVVRLVGRLARQAPVAMLLDDLHWADPASLELLHYLARGVAAQRVLILGTYRAEAAEGAHLGRLLASLRRGGVLQEVSLPPLGTGDVASLARAQLDGDPAPELLALLHGRAGGRPLFVETYLRELKDAGLVSREAGQWMLRGDPGGLVPRAIQGIILDRLGQLVGVERRVVDLLAVATFPLPHSVLSTLVQEPEDALLAALHRLRTARLVAEVEADGEVTYVLDHPLIQEVAYAELPAILRRRTHAALAVALEESRGADPAGGGEALERLAFHYLGAASEADRSRALEVFLAAGERARSLYANEQAARHFQAALELVRQGRRADLLPSVLERLGKAWERLGERAAAVAVWEEALAMQEGRGDLDAATRLRHRLALAEWERGHFERAAGHVETAIRALDGTSPSEALADLHDTRATFAMRSDDLAAFEAAAVEQVAVAARSGSPRALARAQLVDVVRLLRRGEYTRARDTAAGVAGLAMAEGDLSLAHRAQFSLANVAVAVGQHQVARRHSAEGLALARQIGAPPLECYPRHMEILASYLAGDWDVALQAAEAYLALTRRLGLRRPAPLAYAGRAIVLARRGEAAAADASLREARAILTDLKGDRHISGMANLAAAVTAIERGEAGEALAWAEALGPALSDTPRPFVLGVLAEAHLAAGGPEEARRIARAIDPGTGEYPYLSALAQQMEGMACRALGDEARAVVLLRAAAHIFRSEAIPFEQARCQLALAGLAASQASNTGTQDAPEAAEAAREAADTFTRLGARPYADRARALLRQLGIRPAPPRAGAGQLSARELEVVRLAAAGLTSEQMAERLVVSPHTVIAHLKRIYQRLGLHSRAALARHAEQAGWLEPAVDQRI